MYRRTYIRGAIFTKFADFVVRFTLRQPYLLKGLWAYIGVLSWGHRVSPYLRRSLAAKL